jgi:hypothetical protein
VLGTGGDAPRGGEQTVILSRQALAAARQSRAAGVNGRA